jgi:hypothetical protein
VIVVATDRMLPVSVSSACGRERQQPLRSRHRSCTQNSWPIEL